MYKEIKQKAIKTMIDKLFDEALKDFSLVEILTGCHYEFDKTKNEMVIRTIKLEDFIPKIGVTVSSYSQNLASNSFEIGTK